MKSAILKFKGCSHFRQRLVCSILSGKPVKITAIRAKFETPGLQGKYFHLFEFIYLKSNFLLYYDRFRSKFSSFN